MTHRLHALVVLIFLTSAAGVSFSAGPVSGVIEGKENWLFPGWESLTERKLQNEQKSAGLIAEVSKGLAARNIKLIVFVVPTKVKYYRDQLPDGMAVSDAIERRYDALLTYLGAASVAVTDVREAFKSVTASKQDVFYRTDYHWTSFAAEATADYIATLIKQDGPLPGDQGSGTKLGEWMNDRHLGDLAANFLPPERKRAIGPESFVIRKPETGGTNLIDEKLTAVAVVGNSFVQPYFGFPQRLSNVLDRPVFLKWNPGDVGPWATFLQFVQSNDFKTKPPKIVVWQFIEAKFENGPDAVGEWLPQGIMSVVEWQSKIASEIKN